jgi:hypothetical protein
MRGQIGGRDDRSGQNISDSNRKARLDSAAAIKARVREMVLVTKASGSPASRNRRGDRPLKPLPRHDQDGQPRLRNKFRK